MTEPDPTTLIDAPTRPAAPADLDLVELAAAGAPLPELLPVDPAVRTVRLEDSERTPVALLTPVPGSGALSLTPLRPLSARPALLRHRDGVVGLADAKVAGATAAVLFAGAPTLAAVASLDALPGTGPLLVGALVGRGGRSGEGRVLDAVVAVARSWSSRTGRPAPVVAVPWREGSEPGVMECPALRTPAGLTTWLRSWWDLDTVVHVADEARHAPLPPSAFPAEVQPFLAQQPRRGLVVLFTGYSGSGKSTIARGVEAGLEERGRTVTVLDGDEVRALLSAGLGFDAEGRSMNVRRIGWVASLIARHGGVALAAPIAPFAADRAEVRRMVLQGGDRFVLVHVSTPLEVCEERDRKGLYARARAGLLPDFTGISSPYEAPTDADVVVDTSRTSVDEAVSRVLAALEEEER